MKNKKVVNDITVQLTHYGMMLKAGQTTICIKDKDIVEVASAMLGMHLDHLNKKTLDKIKEIRENAN